MSFPFLRTLALPVLASLSLLSGCAASHGPLKTYDGPLRTAEEVATVDVPEQVQVMSIDGREPPTNFLTSQVQLALLPGEHVLGLRYVQLFQVNSEDHDVVRSRQAALRFTAIAGGRYRLEAPPQRDREAARQFAKDPHFSLADLGGGAAVESTAVKSYAEASLIDTLGQAFESQQESRPVTNTDLLKDIWNRSSAGEREAFRAWINEPAK